VPEIPDPDHQTNDARGSSPNHGLRTHPFNVTLHGLEELDQFSTDAERQAALKEIADEAADLTSKGYWLGVGILVGVTLSVWAGSAWLLTLASWPSAVKEILRWLVMATSFFLTLRWLHRWGAREELREKLLARGVPICIKCGYSLRGATPESTNCPECGQKIDERAAKILASGKNPLE